eukprot:824112-Alexandrium_andersonii.AAC.1
MPLVRQCSSHSGVVVNWYAFDGLMVKPLHRLFSARHAAYYSEHGPMHQPEHKLLELTEWTMGM